MDGVLTPEQEWRIADAVWLGSTVPDAFEEVGLDFHKLHPFLDTGFCRLLIDVASVAKARDRGTGIIPGQGFVS